jgi:hypothetical protein
VSASFVMPAVVRLRRTPVARRALLVVLFLGGFLALAFLFGGHAQAAGTESAGTGSAGTGSAGLTGSQSGREAGEHLRASVHRSVTGVPHAVDRDAQRTDAAMDTTLKPVAHAADQLSKPVGDVVEPVTDLPGKLTSGLGRRVGGDSANGSGHAAAPAPGGDPAGKLGPQAGTSGFQALSCMGSVPPEHAAHAAQPADAGGADHRAPFDSPQTPVVPASQCESASGNSSPRGTDQHATLPSGRTGFALTAGAVSTATVAPVRERSGDVLEFPA